MTAESVNEDFVIEGDPPSPFNVPQGCRFNPRCAFATDECRTIDPELRSVDGSATHSTACLHSDDLPEFSTIRLRTGAIEVPDARPVFAPNNQEES